MPFKLTDPLILARASSADESALKSGNSIQLGSEDYGLFCRYGRPLAVCYQQRRKEETANYVIFRIAHLSRCFLLSPWFMRNTMTENLMKSSLPATPSAGSRARNIDGQPSDDLGSLRTNQLLTTAVAADLLGLTVKGLEGMRMRRIGPPFVCISRRCVRYRLGDLERFIMTKMVRTESEVDVSTC